MRISTLRFLALGVALVLGASAVEGATGKYQRTQDRKALVWNSDPQPGDSATWSGERDDDGYASGYGTLTWYTTKQAFTTGSNIPSAKPQVFAAYTGNMVHGKLDGAVNAVAKGKKSHATFAEGKKSSEWIAGHTTIKPGEATKKTATREVAKSETESAGSGSAVATERPTAQKPSLDIPAVGPSPEAVAHQASSSASASKTESTTDVPAEGPSKPQQKAPPVTTNQSGKKMEMDDSLKALVGPPSLLHRNGSGTAEAAPGPSAAPFQTPVSVASPAPVAPASETITESASSSGPQLSEGEVVGLADAEARTQGNDLGEFEMPKVQFQKASGTWSAVYDGRKGGSAASKHLNVTIDDKTRKASVAK